MNVHSQCHIYTHVHKCFSMNIHIYLYFRGVYTSIYILLYIYILHSYIYVRVARIGARTLCSLEFPWGESAQYSFNQCGEFCATCEVAASNKVRAISEFFPLRPGKTTFVVMGPSVIGTWADWDLWAHDPPS